MLEFLMLVTGITVAYWLVREPDSSASWWNTTGGEDPRVSNGSSEQSSYLLLDDGMASPLNFEDRFSQSAFEEMSSTRGFLDDDDWLTQSSFSPGINPATGLPMLDGAIDVAGNPYGCGSDDSLGSGISSSSLDDHWQTSSFDSDFGSSSSSWDDNW